MNQNFVDFMAQYSGRRMAVAVSGGVDSVCLLCWLAQIGADIVCLHVNHGLRAAADAESEYVRDLCAELGVPCHVFYWTGDKPASNLEDAARRARYNMMIDFCHANGIDVLLTAHQADDQIETFLMNLGRGSGLFGLAAMRGDSVRDGIHIVRPLLGVWRTELVKYCDENGIKYFADEMNDDEKYTRVKIRKNRHVLRDMLGISDARILLATQNLGRARDAAIGRMDELINVVRMYDGTAMFSESFLFDLGVDVGLKFIGSLIQQIGGQPYQPRLKSLELALNKLGGECKFTLGGCTIRRFRDQIMIVPEGNRTSFRKKYEKQKRYIQK